MKGKEKETGESKQSYTLCGCISSFFRSFTSSGGTSREAVIGIDFVMSGSTQSQHQNIRLEIAHQRGTSLAPLTNQKLSQPLFCHSLEKHKQ